MIVFFKNEESSKVETRGDTRMIWPTSCAALKGRVFQHPEMHCKGTFLWNCTVRVEFFIQFKEVDEKRVFSIHLFVKSSIF